MAHKSKDLGAYRYAMMQTKSSGLAAYAQKGKFDIIVHNGDLVCLNTFNDSTNARQAYNLGSSNGAVGDDFMDNLQPICAAVPYMVTPGKLKVFSLNVKYCR